MTPHPSPDGSIHRKHLAERRLGTEQVLQRENHSQYTNETFQRLMADYGITRPMSRSGNVWDNAAMESFFSSLKTERTARRVYRTRDDARAPRRVRKTSYASLTACPPNRQQG